MFKRALKWAVRRMIPTVVDFLQDQLQVWIDDPNTDTDEKTVEAVGNYIEYLANQAVK